MKKVKDDVIIDDQIKGGLNINGLIRKGRIGKVSISSRSFLFKSV